MQTGLNAVGLISWLTLMGACSTLKTDEHARQDASAHDAAQSQLDAASSTPDAAIAADAASSVDASRDGALSLDGAIADAAADASSADMSFPVSYLCGGPRSLVCPRGQICVYDRDTNPCGDEGNTGVCVDAPRTAEDTSVGCTEDIVCGCDGVDYDTQCEAWYNGVDSRNVGTCDDTPPTDCRTTGCSEGYDCQACWTSYACIPHGAVC